MEGKSTNKVHARWLTGILLVSLAARIGLAVAGGQFYWPDEERYISASMAVDATLMGEPRKALRLLHTADHFLFRIVSLLPATVERFAGPHPAIPAIFFSLFSVTSIWLIWRITLALRGAPATALATAGMMALSTTCFYYSRHLLPYDLSLALGLSSLLAAVRTPRRTVDSCLCGLLACLCFLAYNGYWTLAGFAMLVHTLYDPRPFSVAAAVRRGMTTALSFVAPIAFVLVGSRMLGGDMLGELIRFSRTINQGVFSEGWSLPFEYLWAGDGLLVIVWSTALVAAIWLAGGKRLSQVAWIGLAGMLFVYASLLIFSVGLHKFVVYGRLARQLVPFACLLSGALLTLGLNAGGTRARRVATILWLVLLAQTGLKWSAILRLDFPRRFQERAARVERAEGDGPYMRINVRHIHDTIESPPPSHEVLLRSPHPVNFTPYHYEGYKPAMRRQLRSQLVEMMLTRARE